MNEARSTLEHARNNRNNRRMKRQKQRSQEEERTKKALVPLQNFRNNDVSYYQLPPMTEKCAYCGAYLFPMEKTMSRICCMNGCIKLEPLEYDAALVALFYNDSESGKEFRNEIRNYNSAFAFSSLGVNLDHQLASSTSGYYTFRIQGQLYHNIGSLTPEIRSKPRFAQVYFQDPSYNQVDRRYEIFKQKKQLDRINLNKIQDVMEHTNPYVHTLKTAREKMTEENYKEISIHIVKGMDLAAFEELWGPKSTYRYSPSTVNEIAAIIPDVDIEKHNRDIVLTTRKDEIRRITELHGAYDCMAYPLFGNNMGFRINLDRIQKPGGKRHQISVREFYAYRLHRRDSETNLFLQGGRLFHQFIVDQFTKMEHQRLLYNMKNQKQLRGEMYQGLMDHTPSDTHENVKNIGRRIVLPGSYIGSPRYLHKQYQDALTIVEHYGQPSYFITFTTNPHWKEITDALPPTQSWSNRPDIVVRVFRAKFQEFLHDLIKNHALGHHIAHVAVVEFQKGGLPHGHILLIVAQEDRIHSPEDIDRAVSAELPDQVHQKELFDIVIRHNIHGPCGTLYPKAKCMKDGTCIRHYPKEFNATTYINDDSYPMYKRPNNGRTYTNKQGCVFDNRSIVPYNPYLSKKYQCHINVEVCTSLSSIKYIYKYVYKGVDRALLEVDVNECQQYLDSRYVTAYEACWKIFGFGMYFKSHSVVDLPCHLENQQYARFADEETVNSIQEMFRRTKLTAFFKLCATSHRACATLLYKNVIDNYSWDKAKKEWKKRIINHSYVQLARMHMVHVSQGEVFYLRTLLNIVPGPKCFADVRTFNGITYETYKEACNARGLLKTDTLWDACLEEATRLCLPHTIRSIFAIILVFNGPTNPGMLFYKYLQPMSDDYIHSLNTATNRYTTDDDGVIRAVVGDINEHLKTYNRSWVDFPELPDIQLDESSSMYNEYMNCDPTEVQNHAAKVRNLNNDQATAFNIIQHSIDNMNLEDPQPSTKGTPSLFFIDGPGGHGKTYLLNATLGFNHQEGNILLATASSGMSSLLLFQGRTGHYRFKLPLIIDEFSTCNISKESVLAHFLRKAKAIMWDEVTMMHRFNIEALNRTLQDICGNKLPFGGKIIIFVGDFRQVLPIIRYASSKSKVIASCINKSPLWVNVHRLYLRQNMRLDEGSISRANYLLEIGEGRIPVVEEYGSDFIELPAALTTSTSLDELIMKTFGMINATTDFSNKVILSPWNKTVTVVNDLITDCCPGNTTDHFSIDTIENNDPTDPVWPMEFLNSLHINGIPNYHLRLKAGMIVMVLRNIMPRRGIMNGTRLSIVRIHSHLIEGIILNGNKKGNTAFIPRITLNTDSHSSKLPFVLSRLQYPLQVAFAMTIDKSEGQTIDHVGVYLPNPVFSHGQLYVALSRCPTFENLHVFIDHEPLTGPYGRRCTRNIVYKEVFKT